MELDLNFVRSNFPAFKQSELRDFLFFENAGGSYVCNQVIDRLLRFYTKRKMQPYGAAEPSKMGGEEMDEARIRLAAMTGVEEDEVTFGPSTTQNTYVLAQAFGRMLKPGDSIIVTNQDHEANSGPWRNLSYFGINIKEWLIDPEEGHLNIEDLKNLLDDSVKLVCFPHCSNVIGEINPVKKIVEEVQKFGAYVCVDGVSFAPHGLPNMKKLKADIYLFSSYKTYGPHQGVMLLKKRLGVKLPNQGHFFNNQILYKRLSPAGPDHAQVAACAGIADYFEGLYNHHFSEPTGTLQKTEAVNNLLQNWERSLMEPLLSYLGDKNSVRLLGPKTAKNRAPTIAFKSRKLAAELAKDMAKRNIIVGGDNFYAVRPLEGLGINPKEGVLRISFVHYTSKSEINRVIEVLDELI